MKASLLKWVRHGVRYVIFCMQRYRQRIKDIGYVGVPCIIDPTATFVHHKGIRIGRYTRIGAHCHLDGEGGVEIGDGAIFASNVVVLSSSHRFKQESLLPYNEQDNLKSVKIGRGAWLCWGAMLRPGVQVGDGAVVGMGAVVWDDVPPGAVVAGNPAKVIACRSESWVVAAVAGEKYFLKAAIEDGLRRPGQGDYSREGGLMV